MKKIALFIFLLPSLLLAQTPADWWYFGQYAGIHFTPTGPVADTNGQLTTLEGVATISSSSGDLLFYSDGSTVWDANHDIMPNGTGLNGNSSSTQSAIILKRPGSTTDYYIFTVQNNALSQGMQYSRVDMTLNAGMGDIDINEKNIPLVTPTAEKVSAIPKPNGFWVITLKLPGDTVYAYEVTSAGVNLTPVTSSAGFTLATGNFLGYLKPNLQGDRLAAIHYQIPGVFLYDFDANTGVASNAMQLTTSITSGYGVEFSPSGDYLYASSYSTANTVQYDLTLGTAAAISASETLISSGGAGGGTIQLGPDNKIYNARWNRTFLSRINDPDQPGALCNWQDTAVDLMGRSSQIGLPTFLQAFFNISFAANDHCLGVDYQFVIDTVGVDSIFWNFGDPTSGTNDTSYAYFPSHTFTDTGSFTVMLIAKSDTLIDTAYSTLFVYPRQTLNLGPDTTLCGPDTVVLDVSQAFSSFLWSDSSTADSFLVTSDTTVWVQLNGVCDTLRDSISIQFQFVPNLNLGPDSTFCEGLSLSLNAGLNVEAAWSWNTGDSTETIAASQTGTYIFEATNVCGTFADTVEIEVIPLPSADTNLLPADSLHCFDEGFFIQRPLNDTVIFIWSDSSSDERFFVDTTMTVWLAAFNECGFSSDTMRIIFNGEIKTELGEDTVICDEDSIRLFGTDSLATYLWNTGDTTDTITTPVAASKNYIVTITLRDCQAIESREVVSSDTACPDIDCDLRYGNVFTPNGDGWNDRFRIDSDCDIFKFSMSIYNRWGQLVHESSNVAYGWDGYVNGEPASAGTYFFTVRYKDFVVVNADRFLTNGSFSLLR
ncbi:MAG: gliding motility-associated C-terminal domain-containing protein [Flavobacteriales bacterium]|nr:gliding motility-associated C-terminal domain-containing protein [Flavobacteriales bacterium]